MKCGYARGRRSRESLGADTPFLAKSTAVLYRTVVQFSKIERQEKENLPLKETIYNFSEPSYIYLCILANVRHVGSFAPLVN